MSKGVRWGFTAALLAVLVGDGASGQCYPGEVARLLASDGASDDEFGNSVSISGDFSVVGAWLDDNESGEYAGAAYIFHRNASGAWIEVAKITSSDGGDWQRFGYSVAISDDTVVVGVPADSSRGPQAGAAYIFQNDGSSGWFEIAKITASDAEPYDTFGYSVSISGDTVIVGAIWDDDVAPLAGSAYVFRDEGTGNWVEISKITASDGAADDSFGADVAISGDTAIIGAQYNDDHGTGSGSAYICRDDGAGNWIEIDKLTASDADAGDRFGNSVSISGDTAIVGALLDENGGSAYVFSDDGTGDWVQDDKIRASDAFSTDYFGFTVGISGSKAVVGDFWNSAYFFHHDGGGDWIQVAKIDRSGRFSSSVAIDQQTAIVGAEEDYSGSAYLFDLNCVDGVPATLTSFSVSFGTLVSGGLNTLRSSDEWWLRARSAIGFLATEPNLIQLDVSAVTEVNEPDALIVIIEGRIDQPGGTSRLRLRNWMTNALEQVHQYPIGTAEIVEIVDDVPAADRVRASDGRIELSLRQSVFATFSVMGFTSSTDQVAIAVR